MDNLVFIVNDSLRNDAIGDQKWGKSATPFIDSIKSHSFVADNMYSQAPYTEAALKALISGKDVLDDTGYYYRFNKNTSSIFHQLKENGYETFLTSYPDFWFSSEMMKDIDYIIYCMLPSYKDFYTYRVKYYIDTNSSQNLSDYQINKEIELFDIEFFYYIKFFEDYLNDKNDIRYSFVKNQLQKIDVKKIVDIWNIEKSKFEKDKKNYIKCVIKEGENHILYKTSGYIWNLETDGNNLLKAYENNKSFFAECVRFQNRMNLKNDVSLLKLAMSFFVRLKQKIFKQKIINFNSTTYFSNWHSRMNTKDFEKLMKNFLIIKFEVWTSFRKQVDFLIDYLDKRKNDKPFCFFIHNPNPHYLCTPITYDSEDFDIIQSEINELKKDRKKISDKFSGFLSYRFAARYIDYTTEYLFSELTKRNLLDKTTIAITSDHGSSFGPGPVRSEPFVNNNFSENYRIPFIVYNNKTFLKSQKLATSKDIAPTVDSILGIDIDSSFTGHSLLDSYNQDIIHSEYMGPGCPDIYNKKIRFVARNKNYKISYYAKLSDNFESGELIDIYKYSSDKLEKNNLITRKDEIDISDLLMHLKERFLKLKEQYELS